jgi:hypothetical protein
MGRDGNAIGNFVNNIQFFDADLVCGNDKKPIIPIFKE